MNQFILLPPDRLRTIYDEAQARRGLPAQSLEKDLWVCWTLRELFQLPPWTDYATMRPGSLRLVPPDHQLDAWRQDYAAMRAEMFFGPAAEFEVVLKSVGEFARQFNAADPARTA